MISYNSYTVQEKQINKVWCNVIYVCSVLLASSLHIILWLVCSSRISFVHIFAFSRVSFILFILFFPIQKLLVVNILASSLFLSCSERVFDWYSHFTVSTEDKKKKLNKYVIFNVHSIDFEQVLCELGQKQIKCSNVTSQVFMIKCIWCFRFEFIGFNYHF